MPTPCQHFALLERRFIQLSQKFLDQQVANEVANPGTFSPDVDQLAAFKLLMHAEFEHFLEEKAKEGLISAPLVTASGATWMKKYPSLIALAIALDAPLPRVELSDTSKLVKYAIEIIDSAIKRIGENNGIKSASFMFLSVCAGKTIDQFDSVLLSSLNSYGKGRGDVAHTSVPHTRSLQAPSTELKAADTLVKQLGAYFDVCS